VNQPDLPIIENLSQERTCETGGLSVSRDGQHMTLPLRSQHIVAKTADRVAEVIVEQSFQNPFQEFLEAIYIFPLGGGAAVSAFEMKVGGRTLKAMIKERGEARQDYQNAIEKGKRAALLEQDRDNVFTVQVGNLPPGEEVSVRIVYSERLSYFEDGATELRLPLVVAPRYIPGEPREGISAGAGVELDTDAVPDASRISAPRLAPGIDPKVALSIEVELADGLPEDIACSQHAVRLSNRRVALSREDEHLNRDFVLRWRLAKSGVHSRLLVNRAGCAMLSLIAPRRDAFLGTPRDVIFVLDRSGSMGGIKMTSAARACSILLRTLGPRDKFAVCAFDNLTDWLQWTNADEAGAAACENFLRAIVARGGTELGNALGEALDRMRERKETMGRESVIVLVTDGQVGNESEIFKIVQRDTAGARIFTVGIDTAVNDAFLQRLSALGGGTCSFCVPGEALEQALASIGREIGVPLITELQIKEADLPAPSRPPDLFAGRASTSFFVGQGLKSVRVQGKFADGAAFNATVNAEEVDLPAIAHLWARARVAELEDRFRLGEDVKQEIINLSIKHMLLTRFTAFVVVDESEIVNGKGTVRTVVQPVEMPDRWELGHVVVGSLASLARPRLLGRMAAAPGSVDRAAFTDSLLGQVFGSAQVELPNDYSFDAARQPLTRPQRAAIEKTIAALAKALKNAGAKLDAGEVPAAEPIERARQALLQALGKSGASVGFNAGLQKFLRSTLVELIAAFSSGSIASSRSTFDRVQREFDELTRQQNFWETSV
jgi:Ca-activated chloride channel family protein